MSFNDIPENKVFAKISESTVVDKVNKGLLDQLWYLRNLR